jgi:putative phosphoesterase
MPRNMETTTAIGKYHIVCTAALLIAAYLAIIRQMRIGLLSDTHGFLDEAVFRYFSECDEVWHAGDIGSPELFDRLRDFKPVRAVYGNVDGAELRAALPADLAWDCEGVGVYMTHIGGYPGNYDPRARKELRRLRPGLFICGHSHILKVMRDPALRLLHMNPGACGNQGWRLVRTLLRFTVRAGKISGAEAIDLGPRVARNTHATPRPNCQA